MGNSINLCRIKTASEAEPACFFGARIAKLASAWARPGQEMDLRSWPALCLEKKAPRSTLRTSEEALRIFCDMVG